MSLKMLYCNGKHNLKVDLIMLVKFTSQSAASVSMFEKDAERLIRLMGYSGTIPSAIRGKDVAARLEVLESSLQVAVEEDKAEAQTRDEDEPAPVPVDRRAYPLIELMKRAIETDEDVMWDYEHSVI